MRDWLSVNSEAVEPFHFFSRQKKKKKKKQITNKQTNKQKTLSTQELIHFPHSLPFRWVFWKTKMSA